MAQLSNQRSSCNNFHVMSLTSSSSTTRTQFHYYTSCSIRISHHNKHVPGGQPLSYLFHTTARPPHCLSVRITPVAAIASIFPFPFHNRKRLRSTFTSLLNMLPFSMFYLLSMHVLNCTVMLYHLNPFSFHMFFFQSLKSRGRSSLSKGSMLGTVLFASCPRKFIPLHTLAAP